jgi:hypothetical protein
VTGKSLVAANLAGTGLTETLGCAAICFDFRHLPSPFSKILGVNNNTAPVSNGGSHSHRKE